MILSLKDLNQKFTTPELETIIINLYGWTTLYKYLFFKKSKKDICKAIAEYSLKIKNNKELYKIYEEELEEDGKDYIYRRWLKEKGYSR